MMDVYDHPKNALSFWRDSSSGIPEARRWASRITAQVWRRSWDV